jgi:hypothetical protein
MTSRLHSRWRIFPFAIIGGLLVVAGQSCDARSKHDAASMNAHPDTAGGMGPQASRHDPSLPSADDPSSSGGPAADEPKPCTEGGNECGDGLICCPRCCIANMGPVCVKAVDGKCPLPDLTVSAPALAVNAQIDNINPDQCEIDEGCVTGPGQRKVLRFDVRIPNGGVSDLVLGNPDAGGPDSPFVYATCHKHFHFKNFARYELVDPDGGSLVVAGRKQAFCAMDSARVDTKAGHFPEYDCTQQGIQIGWEDIYPAELPCQYIDITDVPSGTYHLQVHVNPDHAITESDYSNNTSAVEVDIP